MALWPSTSSRPCDWGRSLHLKERTSTLAGEVLDGLAVEEEKAERRLSLDGLTRKTFLQLLGIADDALEPFVRVPPEWERCGFRNLCPERVRRKGF